MKVVSIRAVSDEDLVYHLWTDLSGAPYEDGLWGTMNPKPFVGFFGVGSKYFYHSQHYRDRQSRSTSSYRDLAVVYLRSYTGNTLWILFADILRRGSLVGFLQDERDTHVLFDDHAATLFFEEASTVMMYWL